MTKIRTEFESTADQLRYRIESSRKGVNGGYGELRSLRNFLDSPVRTRLKEIDDFDKGCRTKKDSKILECVKDDPEVLGWLNEHAAEKAELEPLLAEAEAGLPENGGDFQGWLPKGWAEKFEA